MANANVRTLDGFYGTLRFVMLTIREASEKTGHSPHKIRRLIKAVADQPSHAERSQIEPNSADVERLTAEGVQFTWRISEELVRRELGDAAPTPTAEKVAAGVGESGDFAAMLQRMLDAKETAEARLFEQLRVKDEQIIALNERLRESNVLFASLQKQLPGPAKRPVGVVEVGTSAKGKRPEKGTPPAAKKPRQSWFGKLFAEKQR